MLPACPRPTTRSRFARRGLETLAPRRARRRRGLALPRPGDVGLERSLGRLGAAGIPTLVVKGAILAHWLYARPIERPLRDVDLRVRPGDLRRATEARSRVEPGARLLVRSRVHRSAVLSDPGGREDRSRGDHRPPVRVRHRRGGDARAGRRGGRAAGVSPYATRRSTTTRFSWRSTPSRTTSFPRPRRSRTWRALPGGRSSTPGASPSGRATRGARRSCTWSPSTSERRAGMRVWRAIADRVEPRRRGFAERMLARLRGERHPSELVLRLEARGASDARSRAIAAVAAAAVRGGRSWRGICFGGDPGGQGR